MVKIFFNTRGRHLDDNMSYKSILKGNLRILGIGSQYVKMLKKKKKSQMAGVSVRF